MSDGNEVGVGLDPFDPNDDDQFSGDTDVDTDDTSDTGDTDDTQDTGDTQDTSETDDSDAPDDTDVDTNSVGEGLGVGTYQGRSCNSAGGLFAIGLPLLPLLMRRRRR